MSLFSLILAITFPWAIIHVIRYFYIRKSQGQYGYGSSLLPLPTSAVPSFSHHATSFIQSLTNTTHIRMNDGSTFELGLLSMRFETTRWNGLLATIPFLTSHSRSRHSGNGEGGHTARRDSTDSNASRSTNRSGATFGSHTPAFNSEFRFQVTRPQPHHQSNSQSQLEVNATTPVESTEPSRSSTPANAVVTINTTGRFRTLLHRYLVRFYVLGAGVCLVAMALGMLLLIWSTVGVLWGILAWIFGSGRVKTANVTKDAPFGKRGLDGSATTTDDGGSGLHSLIPGVTVPLSDLPILLCALLFSQMIHELGHAYTGTLESLPILSSGFHLHLAIPTFFVALPLPIRPSPDLHGSSRENSPTRSLSTPSKLRIATAGAWHNFVTWGILALLGWSTISFTGLFPVNWTSSTPSPGLGGLDDTCAPASTGSSCNSNPRNSFFSRGSSVSNEYMNVGAPWHFWSYLGYCNTQNRGPTVINVESSSPLKGYLPVGAIITKVDDVILGGSDGPAYLQPEKKGKKGTWTIGAFRRFFESLETPLEEEQKRIKDVAGWCVPESWFLEQPSECCSGHGQGSCFTARKQVSKDSETSKATIKTETVEKCMDPVPLFRYQHDLQQRASQSTNDIRQYSRDIGGNLDSRGILVEQIGARRFVVDNAIDMGRRDSTGGKNGSAYGTRCHVACLRADGDEETYACVRPRVNTDEERLIRLEIEDPPWLQQRYSHNPFGSDKEENSNGNVRTNAPGDTFGDNPGAAYPYFPPKHGLGRGLPPTRIIVFKGPPSEILDHISLDVLRPRSPLFPPARLPMFFRSVLPGLWVIWWEYVSRVSLSLGFFNLLAIQGLDGGWVFGCVVEWWLLRRTESKSRSRRSHRSRGLDHGPSDEIELLERGEGEDLPQSDNAYGYGRGVRGEWNWRTRDKIEKTVSVATISMGVLVTVATVWKDVA